VRKAIGTLSLLFLMSLPAQAQAPQQPIRVKCGGLAYTDSKGQAWASDYDFSGGLVSATQGRVIGTSDQALFQNGRMPADTAPLVYNFVVADGAYHVNLYFAELNPMNFLVGGRVFNVQAQGKILLQDLDVFKTAGANTALVKSTDIAVTNGQVTIELDNVPGHDRGKITAIEITQSAEAPQLTLNFVHPDGTPVTGTLNYTMATSVLKLGGSTPLTDGQATCVLFAAPQILGLVGPIQVALSLTDTAGHTLWQVGMSMDPTGTNFGAIQSSTLNVIVRNM
jgi:hypothetical protein